VRAALVALLVLVGAASQAVASTESAVDRVSVSIDRSTMDARVGERISFGSTVRNNGDSPATDLVAHLNVLSTDPGVYVDPEDWSAQRTIYLRALPAHGSVRLPWRVQVVNDGRFLLYVAVTTRKGAAPVVASNDLELSATAHRSIDAGGVLPVALGAPGLVLLLLLGSIARRRRHAAAPP
jgi:uncharacterized repeat protein (TIGR01451 family)